jgi:MFS family permease
VLDRRRLILFTQAWMLAAAALLGGLTLAGETTPWILLTLTLLLGLGAAMNAPAWQAIIPELVTRTEIPSAVALNSAGFNVADPLAPPWEGLVVGAMGRGQRVSHKTPSPISA